ncbi:MAG: HepT-like ribonuclease domain-containing protein [Nodosilinea sp.]
MKRLLKSTKERQATIPQIPWPQIISMRNRLTHAYSDIDTDVIWQTIIEDLPELIRELEALSLK